MFLKKHFIFITLTAFIISTLLMISAIPAYAQINQSIELKEGFNFVSLTVTPQDSLSTFLSANTQIEDIFLYSPAAGTFLSVSDNSITAISAGKGYIFLSKNKSSINIAGEALPNINDIKLTEGFNLIGFSKVPENITFYELMSKYSFITGLYSWSPIAGTFISVVRNTSGVIEKLDDSDPSITAGKSYFFYVTKNTVINYDGTSIILDGQQPSVVATPIINPAGGTFNAAQTVSISCATPDAIIKYTLDGSNPLIDGVQYTSEIIISVSKTIKAAAQKTDMTDSNIASADFIINSNPPVPGITDISIPGFDKKALIAVNTNGSESGTTEAVGILPESVNNPSRMIFNFNTKKIGLKDRKFPGRAPLMQASERKRPIITENDLQYTFKVTSGETDVKDLAASKVYGSSTSKCLIFLDDAISAQYDWNSIGQNFDNNIYPYMLSAFGSPTDIDANQKVVILYYDMGEAEMSTYGYFMSDDLTLGNGLNEMEIFYMNIKYGIERGSTATANPLDPELIRTLAHEFQHLINYGQRVMIKKISRMDSWMDEGMAESAEQIIAKTPGESRINSLKADANNKIRNGAPLCVWMNDDESYALAYTFMQYCKNHAKDREEMFKMLIGHTNGDYRAVEDIMKNQNSELFNDFASIVIGYRVANLVNSPTGAYGYGSENNIFNFSASAYAPSNVNNIMLPSGGAVYIYPSDTQLSNFQPDGQGSNIKFIRINK